METKQVKIYKAMAAILQKTGAIGKDRNNRGQGYKFRGVDDVYNSIHEILAENSVFMTTTVLDERSEERKTKSGSNLIYRILTIKFTFWADDGSNVSSTIIGEGMDSGDKASNKALSVAHKYAILQAFCIPTNEQKDPENESQESSVKTVLAPNDPDTKTPEYAQKRVQIMARGNNIVMQLDKDSQQRYKEKTHSILDLSILKAYIDVIEKNKAVPK